LGAIASVGYLVLGATELAVRIDDELMPLLFWLPTLWGAAGLMSVGIFVARARMSRLVFVVTATVVGSLPSMWTLALPLLSVALVVMVAREPVGDESVA